MRFPLQRRKAVPVKAHDRGGKRVHGYVRGEKRLKRVKKPYLLKTIAPYSELAIHTKIADKPLLLYGRNQKGDYVFGIDKNGHVYHGTVGELVDWPERDKVKRLRTIRDDWRDEDYWWMVEIAKKELGYGGENP